RWGGGVDERRARRAAGERLDAERPGAGEQVEHVEAVDRAEDGEERLADTVGRGTGAPTLRGDEAPPAELPRDHAHAPPRRLPLRPRGGAGGRRSARGPPQARVLRPLEARVVAQRPPRDLACLGQLAAVAGEARVAEVGGPGLPNPHDAALAPDLEVQLGQAESVVRLDERLQAADAL